MVNVSQISAVPESKILEGPHWDFASQSLYFNDILEGRIFRYDYDEDVLYSASIDGEASTKIGFIVPVEGLRNEFVIGCGARLMLIQWDGRSQTAQRVKALVEVDQDMRLARFNDAKCDPRGRIFAGTMMSEGNGDVSSRVGKLYRYDSVNGKATELKQKIGISNGLTWNETTNKFYYIDSLDQEIKDYDYNPETGEIRNERVLINFKPETWFPDGMTIDTDGNLYVATFDGGKVIKVNPVTKKIVQEIVIPNVKKITSVAFGGPNLDELFVTTANLGCDPSPAGGLFKITGLGVKGTEMHKVDLS